MSLQEQWHRDHVARRRRMQANAVVDAGIDLRRKPDDVVDLDLHRREAETIVDALADGVPIRNPLPTSRCLAIQRVVADFYRLPAATMQSPKRSGAFVYARQVAMYLVRNFTTLSTTEIGRRFGGRDHTTVMHGLRRIERLLAMDERLRDEIQLLTMRIQEN